ncbi:MAG: 1-deoxy-D-xylulose-5-phosphate reductoisomerase [Chloroflexi bacterium]|nr:1-deoxy-D-xylulose-5-phosphate reductoisomerase [Chloroflexota bacterium]
MDRVLKKRIAVLGSTGSIGQQTLEVARAFPDKLEVIALAAGSNSTLLDQQVQEFQPKLVSLGSQGPSLEEISTHPDIDLVVVATSGKAGLLPTLEAIRSKKIVALANKEVLVMAGEIVMAEARKYGMEIKPVDSEHSAIWQCLQGEESNEIAQILLTASGGAFRDRPYKELAHVTAEEALRHPTWNMGPKVTIDSANLMNKGMEVIEAHWLFGVQYDKIKVMIHHGSIIHSMVEFADGSIKAQLGVPDMRIPIQYALSHPERWDNSSMPKLDFDQIDSLKFAPVDFDRYPCLKLAFEAGAKGDTYPAVLSAADEIAIELFLDGKIGFLDIPKILEDALGRHTRIPNPSLDDILTADAWAREIAKGRYAA